VNGLDPIADLWQWTLTTLHSPAGYGVGTWFLALVFLWSGAPKLIRPLPAAVTITDFGVVSRPRAWMGATLGALELVLGVGLLIGRALSPWLTLATLLLVVFEALILRALLRGDLFPCNCFGGGEAEEVSPTTLVRTGFLALLAGALAVAPLTTVSRTPLSVETYLGLVTAGGLLLTSVVLSRVPRLLLWNREVTVHYRARAGECAQ
jgi:hypothetical protein